MITSMLCSYLSLSNGEISYGSQGRFRSKCPGSALILEGVQALKRAAALARRSAILTGACHRISEELRDGSGDCG